MRKSIVYQFLGALILLTYSCKIEELSEPQISSQELNLTNTTIEDDPSESAFNLSRSNIIKAEGTINYHATGFIPLSFDASGNPTSARLSMEGEGKIHPFGKVTVVSSFTFDFIHGVGKDFESIYTDNHDNKIYLDGSSVLIGAPNGVPEYIVTENIVGSTGRYEDLKGGGESHVYQTQSVPAISGYYDVKWRISLGHKSR